MYGWGGFKILCCMCRGEWCSQHCTPVPSPLPEALFNYISSLSFVNIKGREHSSTASWLPLLKNPSMHNVFITLSVGLKRSHILCDHSEPTCAVDRYMYLESSYMQTLYLQTENDMRWNLTWTTYDWWVNWCICPQAACFGWSLPSSNSWCHY